MPDGVRAWLLRVMKVPADPSPPPGDPNLVHTFRASPHYFRYTVAVWALKQAFALAGLFASYYFFRNFFFMRGYVGWIRVAEFFAIAGFIAQLPFSFALLRLNFEMRWYILSDRSLRIREGILSVHEQTMAFANIQHISIRQNPLQRLFGIATVVVRAAGGGSSSTTPRGAHGGGTANSHEATFEGVDNAEQIRTAIRDRIRMHRDSGLGDPDDHRSLAPVGAPTHGAQPRAAVTATRADDVNLPVAATLRPALDAAGRLLDEAVQLRAAAAGR
jgi:membrane protein YdbS with pleckstrin-like domain